MHLMRQDCAERALGPKVAARSSCHSAPRSLPPRPLLTLISCLLKQHMRPNNHIASCRLRALGEGRAAGHVRGVEHDGVAREKRLRDCFMTLWGDRADNDPNVREPLEGRNTLCAKLIRERLPPAGSPVVDEDRLLDTFGLAQCVHGSLGSASRTHKNRSAILPGAKAPRANLVLHQVADSNPVSVVAHKHTRAVCEVANGDGVDGSDATCRV
mmetsp:Transcript_6207/g.12025  ORF Transcript_6207/g.12025 Transcript_6207/m.12025 type:complete len:213 (-) Transcript_6207:432-1070(-)